MGQKIIRHGSHFPGNDKDGYMYAFNTSKGYSFNSHIHKCYEFIHIIHGHLLYMVEGIEYSVSDGDIVMTNPNEFHSFSFPEECEYQREFLHIYPGFLESSSKSVDMLKSRKNGTFNHIPSDKVIKYGLNNIFEDIRNNCENPTSETDLIVFANTLLLIAKAHQMIANDAPQYSKVANKKANSIYSYIDNRYMENIDSKSVASEMFMSVSGAERLFKRETGMTIKAYLTLRRVTAAKNLIMEGQKVTNIYTKCGFRDYSTFYRAFVKYVGMTPDKFKRTHNERKT